VIIYELHTYRSRNNKKPFDQWLSSIKNEVLKFQIMRRLDQAKLGNLGDYKFLGYGIYEFRIHYQAGYRIYFGLKGDDLILLLGGDKSKQTKDIKRAQLYWQDFQEQLYE